MISAATLSTHHAYFQLTIKVIDSWKYFNPSWFPLYPIATLNKTLMGQGVAG
jgi:hypothetical protein